MASSAWLGWWVGVSEIAGDGTARDDAASGGRLEQTTKFPILHEAHGWAVRRRHPNHPPPTEVLRTDVIREVEGCKW